MAMMAVMPMPRAISHGELAVPHGRTVLGLPVVAVVAMVVVQSISHLARCVHDTWRGCVSFVALMGIRGTAALNPKAWCRLLPSRAQLFSGTHSDHAWQKMEFCFWVWYSCSSDEHQCHRTGTPPRSIVHAFPQVGYKVHHHHCHHCRPWVRTGTTELRLCCQ